MDFFGIGPALIGAMNVYFRAARQTGRTTALLENVKDGDRVVFRNQEEMRAFQRLVAERALDLECVVAPIKEQHRLFQRPTPKGRTIFDHTWVEDYYRDHLRFAQERLATLERELSRPGAAHRETRQAALEGAKFK